MTDAVALARTGRRLTGVSSQGPSAEGKPPWKANYLVDPLYAEKCMDIFGAPPEQPLLELFVPEEYRTPDLLNPVRSPIWALEWNVIWPHLAELLRRSSVRGDLLEFGVYNGVSFRRHIEIFRATGVIGRYYGFDSFKGLPRPDGQNDAQVFWEWEGVFSDTSKEGVLQYLREGLDDLSDVELVEGYYSDTLPTIRERLTQVAFVRVDCDLYSSTTDVFNFLFGRLVDGAIIYFDDWTHEASTGETKAFFEFAERAASSYKFERLLTVSDGALAVQVRKQPSHRSSRSAAEQRAMKAEAELSAYKASASAAEQRALEAEAKLSAYKASASAAEQRAMEAEAALSALQARHPGA